MTTITPEQRLALDRAGDRPVPLTDPATNETFVLLRAGDFERMKVLLDEAQAAVEERAWLDRAKKARLDWVRENPY